MTPVEWRYPGKCASAGLAFGPLVPLTMPSLGAHAGGSGMDAPGRLRAALQQAIDQLLAIAEREGSDASAILELQIEMLRDPVLLEDVLPAVERGEDPAIAWWRNLDARVSRFLAVHDESVRARGVDIADLRDRVYRILSGLCQGEPCLPRNAIVLADDLTPSGFLSLDWHALGGAVLREGSAHGHVAVLARGRGIPLLTQVGLAPQPAEAAILDAEQGALVVAPSAASRAELLRRQSRRHRVELAARREMAAAAQTLDGTRVSVRLNIDDPETVPDDVLLASEGVGLVRTEALFLACDRIPSCAEYTAAYQRLLSRLGPVPCVFRTLDLGGDKPLGAAGADLFGDVQHLRGLRLCLAAPALFRPQVRALLRIAVDPRVQVMFPMVTSEADFEAARLLFTEELATLDSAGEAAAMPPLGMMVETPGTATAMDRFDADFYAIGSNDLTCAVLGRARGEALDDVSTVTPEVLRLVEAVVRSGRAGGREVCLCGDLAVDPSAQQSLLAAGLRQFSVAPARFAAFKQGIRRLHSASTEVE